MTETPSSRARSSISRARSILGQLPGQEALRWLIRTLVPVRRPISTASSRAGIRFSPSPRMWEK